MRYRLDIDQYAQILMSHQIHKSTAKVFAVAANAVLGSFLFGYSLSYLNVSFNTVNDVFDVDESHQSTIDGLLSATLPLGACLGAFLSGSILDVFTRRQSLIFTDMLSIIGLVLGEVKNIYALSISRIIIGVAVGFNSALVPLYIREFTPLQLRGSIGSMTQITINIGVLTALVFGLGYVPLTNDNSFWRVVFIVPAFTSVLRTVLLIAIFKDDPPGYYVSIDDTKRAMKVLGDIYIIDQVEAQYNQLISEDNFKKVNSKSYGDMFTPQYRNQLIVGCCMTTLMQFCGINAVTFYSTAIFMMVTDNSLNVALLNVAVGLINITFATTAGFLMTTFGRKTLLIYGDIVCCVCQVSLSVFAGLSSKISPETNELYEYSQIVFIFLFLIGFQLSIGPVTWLYLPEILPEKGVSIAVLVNWICVTIFTFLFPIVNKNYGIQYSFGFQAVICILGAILIQCVVQETKDRNAGSIDILYQRMTKETQLLTQNSSRNREGSIN